MMDEREKEIRKLHDDGEFIPNQNGDTNANIFESMAYLLTLIDSLRAEKEIIHNPLKYGKTIMIENSNLKIQLKELRDRLLDSDIKLLESINRANTITSTYKELREAVGPIVKKLIPDFENRIVIIESGFTGTKVKDDEEMGFQGLHFKVGDLRNLKQAYEKGKRWI